MMATPILAPHRHYTTVAATHPTSHDALNRHLTWTAEVQSRFRHGSEQSFKWRDNSPAFTRAAIFGRQHQVDAHCPEHVEVKELGRLTSAVKERGGHAAGGQRFAERSKRREAHAASHHPGFGGRVYEREGSAERTETGDRVAFSGTVDQSGGRADALVEQ